MLKPNVYKPDGTLTDNFVFRTTIAEKFFSGVLPENTIDVQVSIRGGAFVSNPDLIVFEDRGWSMPNPEVYPNGLELVAGENTIQVRCISTRGNTSDVLNIRAHLIQDNAILALSKPPTNISITREHEYVTVRCEGITDPNIVGYNFYASTEAGGGGVGYNRINLNTIRSGTTTEDFTELQNLSFLEGVATNSAGDHLADPQFISISTQQKDILGNVLQTKTKTSQEIPEGIKNLRIEYTVSASRSITTFSFKHSRLAGNNSSPATVFNSEFSSLLSTDPLYYTVTAVFFDEENSVEYESVYSAEVMGSPIAISLVGTNLPQVSRNQIRENYISSIYRSNPSLRVEPTSVLSDVVIDPFSSEMERMRFIMDFLNRSMSMSGLLSVDDPNNTGTSVLVQDSRYKQALSIAFSLTDNASTQTFIDSIIEARVGNYGVSRRLSTISSGEVTFFTTRKPTLSYQIPLGTIVSGGGASFRTIEEAVISVSNLASYYNPAQRRWEITVPVQAVSGGSVGNVVAGQIRSSGVPNLSVINNSSFFGGSDLETNYDLIMRTMNAISGSDVGTERGFLQAAADVVGVQNVKVVASGHELMQRDKDSSGTHRGGKVDIWVRADNPATVTDNFAFSYSLAEGIVFEVVGSPTNLLFRAIDPELSEDSPILELLDIPERFSFRNGSTGEKFDITGFSVVQYDTVQLSSSVDQPDFSYGDVIFGDYRRQRGNDYLLTRQPVESITEVKGTVSGVLPSSSYELINPSVPLEDGFSVKEGSYLKIKGFNSEGVRVPSGQAIIVSDETHVVLTDYPEYLNNLGIDPLTVTVTNTAKTITYRSPNHSSGVSDYTVQDNGQGLPFSIMITTGSEIRSGQEVLVSYSYDENFVVTYRVSSSISAAQSVLEQNKPLTADLLVKKALSVPVDIEATVVLDVGVDSGLVDSNIRTNLSNFFSNLTMGQPVRQSDLVEIIDSTGGVSYVLVPLTRLVRQENSLVLREKIVLGQSTDLVYLSTISSQSDVYLFQEPLSFSVEKDGGVDVDFRGVFQNEVLLDTLYSDNNFYMGTGEGRAYIIGDKGLSIEGYSDDATLAFEGYNASQYSEIRQQRTGNRVMVSMPKGVSPLTFSYTVTYYVGYDAGVKNIDPIDAEYLVVGNISLVYDEDQAQVRTLQTGSSFRGTVAASSSSSSGGGYSSGGY